MYANSTVSIRGDVHSIPGMANSVDPDQTAPRRSDLGLNCLFQYLWSLQYILDCNIPVVNNSSNLVIAFYYLLPKRSSSKEHQLSQFFGRKFLLQKMQKKMPLNMFR